MHNEVKGPAMTGRAAESSPSVYETSPPEAAAILNVLSDAILVLDAQDRIRYLNPAAEQLFQASSAQLTGQALTQVIAADHPLLLLVRKVRDGGFSLAEYGV